MTVLRTLAIISFIAGATLLAVGFLRQDDNHPRAQTAPETFDLTTATPTGEPSVAPTDAPTPVPTPAPYDGAVARLKIPALGVDSPIEAIGLVDGNQLDVPHNPHATGWYDIYDKPGFGGNAVFAAHIDYYPDIRGPFYNLNKITEKDEIVVVMDNGTEYHYRPVKYQRYDVSSIPMGDLIWPTNKPADKEWVTLITCGGRFVPFNGRSGPGEYLDRDVVVAERIQ